MIIMTKTHTVHANRISPGRKTRPIELNDDVPDKTHPLRCQTNENLLESNKMDLVPSEENPEWKSNYTAQLMILVPLK